MIYNCNNDMIKLGIFMIKLKIPIVWKALDKALVKVIIALIMAESNVLLMSI